MPKSASRGKGGLLSQGVYLVLGVYLVPGVYLVLGGVPGSGGCLLQGMSAPGGCLLWRVSAPEADTPVDRITDACKNITLAQLR